MSVIVVGLNYRGVPLDLLERFAFDAASLPKGLHQLRGIETLREAVILSTCNRTEVYARVDGFHAGLSSLRLFLSEFHHVPVPEFADRLYSFYEEEAVRHLFSVAGGLDSMVVGEPQIMAQVRAAFRVASEESATGPILSTLFRQAIRVGRRARAETGIGRSAQVFALAGAALAREALGSLEGRTVLLVGAGKMGDVAAGALVREGARVLVANRTPERASAVAERVGGEAVPLGRLPEALERADLVLSATGSPEPIITREIVAEAMERRPDRLLVVLDLALPRDVDPAVGGVRGVTLKDLDDLRDVVAPTSEQMAEIDRVREIVLEEVPKFLSWRRSHRLAPLFEALQRRAEEVRLSELQRAASRLGDLTEEERAAVDAATRSIVAKLFHDPLTNVKAKAGTSGGDALAHALRELYGLPEE